ncbi:MAG: beta-N-acetylhexosaminidase [Alphaproteobacteria bacterium]|nr:beta-N-acetylhexosaminidase [Alphaproteobacteria bacterium]MDP6590633.1 beta-N-acetylhexosaminidase [Alphaproteobacteria bacterium]MDP6818413.1 beta-N-acetylhexosaminidase [Alphaproteobacteria bacterium]
MPTEPSPGSTSTPPRAVIFGCAGPRLARAEHDFFAASNPLGFILFARNCDDPGQLTHLVADLRAAVGRADAPVLIDQEGGRVIRMGAPHWREPPPAGDIGALAERDLAAGRRAAWLNARLIAADLDHVGIDVCCLPVLDLRFAGASSVVGDRAFSADADIAADLGRAAAEGLLAGGVLPAIKHMPGHGRAMSDSHHALPRVDVSLEELKESDFRPFRALSDMPLGLSAHVCYSALDGDAPGTLSATVIRQAIRGAIGFDGLLLSDDLSMEALSGSLGERAATAVAAGCDVALHCNGKPEEMADIAQLVTQLSVAGMRRWARAREKIENDNSSNFNILSEEFNNLMEVASRL